MSLLNSKRCPDCGKTFEMPTRDIITLAHSEVLKRNPKVKLVCKFCAYKPYLPYINFKKPHLPLRRPVPV